MRIVREDSVGLIIDIQERLYPHMYEHEKLAKNVHVLINGLRHLEIPILVTQQYTAKLGPTISAIDEALVDYDAIDKLSFSCCDSPTFEGKLKDAGKKRVIIAGIETHVCVMQTVLDLLEKGHTPVVVADCVTSRKVSDKETALLRMQSEGAILASYESILFELCRFAGTDSFKAISKLVK